MNRMRIFKSASTSLVIFAILGLLQPLPWIWIVAMARDMSGPMTGASAWMMTLHWDVTHLLLLWAMWTVMMTGMMLPSASPLILLYGAAARRSAKPAREARSPATSASMPCTQPVTRARHDVQPT